MFKNDATTPTFTIIATGSTIDPAKEMVARRLFGGFTRYHSIASASLAGNAKDLLSQTSQYLTDPAYVMKNQFGSLVPVAGLTPS